MKSMRKFVRRLGLGEQDPWPDADAEAEARVNSWEHKTSSQAGLAAFTAPSEGCTGHRVERGLMAVVYRYAQGQVDR